MRSEHATAYASKVDWWLVPVLLAPPIVSLGACVAAAVAGSTSGLVLGMVAVVVVAAIYAGVVWPMQYELSDAQLVVTFGLCRRRIPLTAITEVHPTSNPLSAPALSLDRLRIQFGTGFFKSALISPADREHFLDELADKAGLKRAGDRLFRA